MDSTRNTEGEAIGPLTNEQVAIFIENLPAEITEDWGRITFTVAMAILRHFLGIEWVAKHVLQKEGGSGFFRMDFAGDIQQETRSFRIVDLAEQIFNLQHIEGFHECMSRMRSGDDTQIEATYAEIDFARLLYIHDISFNFVVPEKNRSYDFELIYPDGLKICADAKCRIEMSEIRPEAVRHSLAQARKQLPPDRPGMIFVKVPQLWIEQPMMGATLQSIGEEFLRGTTRIVALKFYVSFLSFANGAVMHRHAYKEISNPNNQFEPMRNWDIFRDHTVLDDWNGMPPKWHRIFFQGRF